MCWAGNLISCCRARAQIADSWDPACDGQCRVRANTLLSLCYLGAETDDLHINPNINTEIHLVGQLTMSELALDSYTRSMCATLRLLLGSSLQKQKHISIGVFCLQRGNLNLANAVSGLVCPRIPDGH